MTSTVAGTELGGAGAPVGERTVWLAFTPLDTVFVRDGRSFDAGADTAARPVWPGPSTIAGAVKAAFGGDEPLEVRGPVLAERRAAGWKPYFPVPSDLVAPFNGTQMLRLHPSELPVETDLGEDLQWLTASGEAGKGKPVTGWMPGRQLADYLAGRLPRGRADVAALRSAEPEPVAVETRVGLARTPERTVRPGLLYQAPHLRLREGWALLAQCVVGEDWDRKPVAVVALGGRGRRASVEVAEGVRWPDPPAAAPGREAFPGGRVAVYVATPGLWPQGWQLPLPADVGVRLVAASAGEPEPVATASPAPEAEKWKTSRMLRWAVPAGSVYLLRFPDAPSAARWALGTGDGERGVHGSAYGLERTDRLRTAGFGVLLTGVWT
ncbi:type III-B CRISPR module-associated Cmr3 family protein [Streptomyces sp. NPDC059175]|uniref:type III-B CRISPR module-associated Cmr3 family protein n=1 Tax=Streptomyces sp. NPDC059175 TaxID=3346757 RepID=UPI0036A56188